MLPVELTVAGATDKRVYADVDVAVTTPFVLSTLSPVPITGYGDGVLLGQDALQRSTAVDTVGTIICPLVAHCRLHVGIVHEIAQALYAQSV